MPPESQALLDQMMATPEMRAELARRLATFIDDQGFQAVPSVQSMRTLVSDVGKAWEGFDPPAFLFALRRDVS